MELTQKTNEETTYGQQRILASPLTDVLARYREEKELKNVVRTSGNATNKTEPTG